MGEANYESGDDYVVQFLGYRFAFNAEDFEERVIGAAVKLGLVGSNDLDEDEAADLVELTADQRIEDARSELLQRAVAARVPVAELGDLFVPVHIEQAELHSLVEPRSAEDELPQPVDQ